MSRINTAIVIAATVGILGITVAQSMQVRRLEARLLALESASGVAAVAEVDGPIRSVPGTARAQLGMASAARGNGMRGTPTPGTSSQSAPSGDAEAIVVGSED